MGSGAAAIPEKYRTLRRIAVGGMGEIFLAREQGRLSRLVVIKKMLPDVGAPAMFVDEARIVGHLVHPNICQILELGDDDGVPFIVLEYVRGASIAAIWDRAHLAHADISLPIALRILADTARALHFAHEAHDVDGRPLNIIHRDVTPQNVMVTYDGDVKLMDFGVARADNRQHRTDIGKVKGKIAYMSPEQLDGAATLDRRADVFSLGVMMWELTLRRRLFRGADQVETLRNALACQVPPPRSLDPTYPKPLETLVMRALAADRTQRIATAGEIATALTELIAALGHVERDDIAATVRQLFPDESNAPEDEPTRLDPRRLRTAPLAPEPDPTGPVVITATARVEHAPSPSTISLASDDLIMPSGSSTSAPAQRLPHAPRSGRALPIALVGLLVAAAAGTALVLSLRSSDAPREIQATAPPHANIVAPSPSPPTPAPESAPEPATDPHVSLAIGVGSATPTRHGATDGQRASHRTAKVPVAAGSAEVVVAASAPVPARGLIAVSSDRTAIVLIDGARLKSTPFQTDLSIGRHDIALELAEGGGTLTAHAEIVAGQKTKCMVQAGSLVCATPH